MVGASVAFAYMIRQRRLVEEFWMAAERCSRSREGKSISTLNIDGPKDRVRCLADAAEECRSKHLDVYCESLIMLCDVVLRSVAHTSHPPWPYHIWHNYPVPWSYCPLVFWSFGSSIRCRLSRSQEDGCVCFELRFDTTQSHTHQRTVPRRSILNDSNWSRPLHRPVRWRILVLRASRRGKSFFPGNNGHPLCCRSHSTTPDPVLF
jgi:hypothetical protein